MKDTLTILHASDLQCGRPYVPRAAEALVRLARSVAPNVVVISGDLTQRAKAREFRAAADLMRRLPSVPTVVTPGNHDVPVYRVLERAFAPYRRWRAGISPDLDTVTRVDGATFVALNSTAPWRAVVGGRIDAWQIDWAREAFARCERGEVRALVIHHHFVSTPDGTGGRPLPRAAELVRAFESMEVDFVRGGHVHRIHVRSSRELVGGPDEGVPLVACGTTTSRRGRGPEEGANSLNVLHVSPRGLEIQPHLLHAGAEEFVPVAPMVLALRRAAELTRGAREP